MRRASSGSAGRGGRGAAGLGAAQDELGRDDDEPHRVLEAVGVAGDDVQAPVSLGVGVGLVAGVDQRPAARGLIGDDVAQDVAALRQREPAAAPVAGAANQQPGHQERHQPLAQQPGIEGPADEVVLVAAPGVAERVDVVAHEPEGGVPAVGGLERPGPAGEVEQEGVPGALGGDEVAGAGALGGGVLGVGADVEVEASAGAVEQVRRGVPARQGGEQAVGGLVDGQPAPVAGADQPVLGLDPVDAGHVRA